MVFTENQTWNAETIKKILFLQMNHEVSLIIDLNKNYSAEFYEMSKNNGILLYFYVNQLDDINIDVDCGCCFVALIDQKECQSLSLNIIDGIIAQNINVCIYNTHGDFSIICDLYDKLVSRGFASLFNVINGVFEEGQSFKGLIGLKDLQNFNYNQNLTLATDIHRLRQNALKKYNRSLMQKKHIESDIVFISIDSSVYNFAQRKNLGIEYLVSVLKRAKYKAECLYTKRSALVKELDRLINSSIKVIGFSCLQDNITAAGHAISYIKNRNPKIICIIGGPQAIALTHEFIKRTHVDYVLVGEYENKIVDFMDTIIKNEYKITKINGIKYIDELGVFQDRPTDKLIDDLDSIPFPDYVYEPGKLTQVGIITGRGCPYNCAFCYEGAKEKTVRYRSIENVFEEISILIKNNKDLKMIQCYDDTFTLNSERVLDFCKRFLPIHKKIGICWACEIHCQTVYNKLDMLKSMVKAGLTSAQIGLESCNDDILKKYDKKTTQKMIYETIKNCKLAGLQSLEGNIMLGGAGENELQIESIYKDIEELLVLGRGMLDLRLVIFTPFPNTPISINPQKYGVKILEQQSEYTINSLSNFVSESATMSRQHFVEHYQKLIQKIDNTYKKIVGTFNYEEAQKYWTQNGFNMSSLWGKTLNSYLHIVNFMASIKKEIEIDNVDLYPIRSFDLLSYDKDGKLIIPNTDIVLNYYETKILELCAGKKRISEIADMLNLSVDFVVKSLTQMKERMLVYPAIL